MYFKRVLNRIMNPGGDARLCVCEPYQVVYHKKSKS
jgi:hypothetical protein